MRSGWSRRHGVLATTDLLASSRWRGILNFSPVDVRTLAARHRVTNDGHLVFDRQVDGRTKTGRAAIGTISSRTERLVTAYLAGLQVELHPDAILFRNRSGDAYSRETLGHDFAAIRKLKRIPIILKHSLHA